MPNMRTFLDLASVLVEEAHRLVPGKGEPRLVLKEREKDRQGEGERKRERISEQAITFLTYKTYCSLSFYRTN